MGRSAHCVAISRVSSERSHRPGPVDRPDPLHPLSFCAPHERWDGNGYPDGLKDEQIPLGARILAVVDIFDALTAERAYRKAKTEEWALEYVQSESGGALEPKLVECFSALHRDGVIRGAAHAIPESA